MSAHLTKQEAAALMGCTPAQLQHWSMNKRQLRDGVPRPLLLIIDGRQKARWVRSEVEQWRARHGHV